ncbi:MAG: rhodanese-like domain-containing protein [Lentisphaeria bacterium]|jgi:rhodanese-related sulfurtransferase|nr:rhodanese-like domain-containing protein [Lentisphaeria bacterium]
MFNQITAMQLHDKQASGEDVVLIDVRTSPEFEQSHLPFARNVPLDHLSAETVPDDTTLHVICQSGSRSRQACARLDAAGIAAVNVDGGESFRIRNDLSGESTVADGMAVGCGGPRMVRTR